MNNAKKLNLKNNYFENGVYFVVIAALMWSLDAVLRNNLRASLTSLEIVFWEHLFGSVLVLPFLIYKFKELKNIKSKDWLVLGGIALFPSVLGTLFYTAALGNVNFVPFSVVILLQQLQPLWAISSAKLVLKEPLPPKFIYLAIAALIGAYLIAFPGLKIEIETGDRTFMAGFFAVLAGMFWGLGATFGKYSLNNYSETVVAGVRFVLGGMFAFALMLIFVYFNRLFLGFSPYPLGPQTLNLSLTPPQFLNFVLIVIFSGLGAMLIYYFGLKRTKASFATLCELAWPISALIIDSFFDIQTGNFGFRPQIYSFTRVIGIIIVTTSIFTLSLLNKQPASTSLEQASRY